MSDCDLFIKLILPELLGHTPPLIDDCCSYTGIACVNNRINELKIHDSTASGSIPNQLYQLSNLKILHLYRNKLSGTIPPSLGQLNFLSDLSLGGNSFSGSIPPELGNMSAVIVMYLDGNKLSGAIPQELSRLSNLRTLFLQNNDLTGPVPSSIESMASLTNLNVDARNSAGFVQPSSTPTNLQITQEINNEPPLALIIGIGATIAAFIIFGLIGLFIFSRWSKKYQPAYSTAGSSEDELPKILMQEPIRSNTCRF